MPKRKAIVRAGEKVLSTDVGQAVVGGVVDSIERVVVDKADDTADAVKEGARRAGERGKRSSSRPTASKRTAAPRSRKKSIAKNSTAKRTGAKKAAAKRGTAKKSTAKRGTAKKSSAKRGAVKKSAAKRSTAGKKRT